MHEQWTDRLSEYLDDELPATERQAVEAHLAGCPDCTRTLQELTRIVATASSLRPEPPQTDLWDGIAGRLSASSAGSGARFGRGITRRFAFTMPELAAAAVLLATLSGAAGALLMTQMQRSQGQRFAGAGVDATSAAPIVAVASDDAPGADLMPAVSFADVQYDAAVVDLERALENGRRRLDETTVSVVEQNLSIIDRAIAEARSALLADPSNSYLSGHLVEARRRKLDLLRRTAALMTEAN